MLPPSPYSHRQVPPPHLPPALGVDVRHIVPPVVVTTVHKYCMQSVVGGGGV